MQETKTAQHEWTQMTMQGVDVAGVDGDDVPVVLPSGDLQTGINCRNCMTGYLPEIAFEPCPAAGDGS
jgi:hypothetical protein